jgi:hypothetical protein
MNWKRNSNSLDYYAAGFDHTATVKCTNEGWEWKLTFAHVNLTISTHRSAKCCVSAQEAQRDCRQMYNQLFQQDVNENLQVDVSTR